MGTYKARRKQSKYKQFLEKELNIDCADDPSQNLMVCNAGLVSGIQYEQLAELFSQFGLLEKIVMNRGKSYSFVVFNKMPEASKAFETVNGKIKLDRMDGPIYLLYTKSVPEDDNNSDIPCESFKENMIEGLHLFNDFVSVEEEEMLLNCVNWNTTDQDSEKMMKHRRVKHYGYEFRYDTNNVDKDSPLKEPVPCECDFITDRLRSLGHPLPWKPNQLTVNQYQRGQGIPSHVDTHSAFESPLLSLSLGSDVVMEFKRADRTVPILLPRRSLLVMDDEARYAWRHGITPRSMDVLKVGGGFLTVRQRGVRTSFTLRRVRQGQCCCGFREQCDSQRAKSPEPIPDGKAARLEELYVHQVYENIASHFSDTRTKVWPNVEEFLSSFSVGSVVIDAGCGNGKYFGVNPHIFHVGFDRSAGLVEITRDRGNQVFLSDCLSVPLRDCSADGIISIAVLHHLATWQRRLQALKEMSRVLKAGGRGLVSVWAKDQTKRSLTSYLKQDRKNRRKGLEEVTRPTEDISKLHLSDSRSQLDIDLPIHTARTEFVHQDMFVPWKTKTKDPTKSEVFMRYYHVFEENELVKLCSEAGDLKIVEAYYTEGNWCVVFEKVS